MNAIKFIKDHGVERAREVVEGAPKGVTHSGNDSYWNWDGKTLKRFAGGGFFVVSIYGISDEWVKEAVEISDLKRVVESVDLLKSNGGYEEAKDTFDFAVKHGMNDLTEFGRRLKQAIADYEAIYSNDVTHELSFGISLMPSERLALISVDMSDDTETLDHIENHISPNCEVKYEK